MKTLYITDLDGTLLTPQIEISQTTANDLNDLIDKGLNFSVATARTAATVTHLLSPLSLKLPVVLMNGAAVYDTVNKQYLKAHCILESPLCSIINLFKEQNLSGFFYQIQDNTLLTYYDKIITKAQTDFLNERRDKYNKKFIQIPDLNELPLSNIVYISVLYHQKELQEVYDSLSSIPGIKAEFYRDIYSEDNWYLEIFHEAATKYNGVIFLKEYYGFDKVVSFGDNLNDLPMFKASDESYAVSNAKNDVKKMATAVIDSNQNDGVAKKIKSMYLTD